MEEGTRAHADWRTVAAVVDGGVAIQRAERFVAVSAGTEDALGVGAAPLENSEWRPIFADDDRSTVERGIEVARASGRWDGTVRTSPETTAGVAVDLTLAAPDGDAVVWRIAAAEDRRPSTTGDRSGTAELATTHLATLGNLPTAGGRDAIEQAVCDGLADSAHYAVAWVCEPALDGDRIVPSVAAGVDVDALEPVTDVAEDPVVGRAFREGTLRVATPADRPAAHWATPADGPEDAAIAAVPLAHAETTYGVLVTATTRVDAYDVREREGLSTLGQAVGFVIHAARSRQLLFADELVELEFAFHSGEPIFGQAAPNLGCDLELAGYVTAGEAWVLYVEVEGVDVEAVSDYAGQDPLVDGARVITETDGGGRLEVVVGHSALLETVAAAGATVRKATANPESARLLIEAPLEADVRDVVELITREYPEATLVARREVDREVPDDASSGDLLAGLTERQRSTLQTAYLAGYFDWPRESTAEAVAESLGLAPATLHGHLRKGQNHLLSTLFEGK